MSPLKCGDIIVYEPTLEYKEAQELYGAVGLVIDDKNVHIEEGVYGHTLEVEWLCHIDLRGQGRWTVTANNCRKIGHVELAEVTDVDA